MRLVEPAPAVAPLVGLPDPVSAMFSPADNTTSFPSIAAAPAVAKPKPPLDEMAMVMALFLGTATI